MGVLSFNYKVSVSHIGEGNNLTNYGLLLILQEAATSASQEVGFGPLTIRKTDIIWILLNWKLKVFSRPMWNDEITVKTWPRKSVKCYSFRDFEIYDKDNNLVAIASSKWVLVDLKKDSVTNIPEDFKDMYGYVDKMVFEDEIVGKIREPEEGNNTFNYTISRHDLDQNHHTNNTNYLNYAYEALPKDVFENIDFKNIEIMYRHETRLGDKISCFYSNSTDNEHLVTIKNNDGTSLHCIVKLY